MADARKTNTVLYTTLDEQGREHKVHADVVEITSPVRLDQLDHEFTAAMNWRNPAGLSTEGHPDKASRTSPAQVHVTGRTDADLDVLLTVTQAHQPDPTWQHPAFPSPTADLRA